MPAFLPVPCKTWNTLTRRRIVRRADKIERRFIRTEAIEQTHKEPALLAGDQTGRWIGVRTC
jgi:hypothetical protein